MSDFTGTFGGNQGIQVTLNRDSTNATLPILLRSNPALPSAPVAAYPIVPTATNISLNTFDTDIQMPYTQSYSVGWQRKLTRDSALEVRYVGSRHRMDWDSLNINEANITTNGFLDEFKKAQANLQANMAAGRGATFAYTGAAGTVPLPIFLAHFNAQNSSRAGDASLYTGANWTSAAFLGFLAAQNPEPVRLHVQQRRRLHDRHGDQRLDRSADVPQQRGGGRPARELLRRQPRRPHRGDV